MPPTRRAPRPRRVQVSATERTLFAVDWCATDRQLVPGGLLGCASADFSAYAFDGHGTKLFAIGHTSQVIGFAWSPHAPPLRPPGSAESAAPNGGSGNGSSGARGSGGGGEAAASASARFAVACASGEVRVYDVVISEGQLGGEQRQPVPSIGGRADSDTVVVRCVLPAAHVLVGHTSRAFSVVWSPLLPDRILSGSDDCTARVWDLAPPPAVPPSAALEADGTSAANVHSGAPSSSTADGKGGSGAVCSAVLQAHTSNVRAVLLSSELPWLALTGGWDGQVAAWDVRGGGRLLCARFEHAVDVYAIVAHPQRPFTFVLTSRDNTVRVWSAEELLQPTLAAVALGAAGERLAPWAVSARALGGLPALSGAADDDESDATRAGSTELAGAASAAARKLVAAAAASGGGAPSVRALLALVRFAAAWGSAANLLHLVDAHIGGADVPPELRHAPLRAHTTNATAAIEALRAEGGGSSRASGANGLSAAGAGAGAGVRRQLARSSTSRLALSASAGTSADAPGGARLRRDERAALVAAQQLRLGRFREWCEAQVEAGNWAAALSVAPAVSPAYWADLACRHAKDALARGEPIESIAPVLLASGRSDALVDELLSRAQFGEAALIAAAAAAGRYPPRPPADDDASATGGDAVHGRASGDLGAVAEGAGATAGSEPSELELRVVVRTAAAHLAAAEPIDAACAFLTLPPPAAAPGGGAVDAAIGCLLSGHQPELALAVSALLSGAPELRAHAAWLVSMRCERQGAWELAAAALASADGSQPAMRALCARARLFASASNGQDIAASLSAQHGIAPAAEQPALAAAAEARGELATALAHAALAGRDWLQRAGELALASLRAGLAAAEELAVAAGTADGHREKGVAPAGSVARRAARGAIGALWEARDACRALPADSLDPAARAAILALVSYAGCADAAVRGLAPVLPALYDAAVDGAAAMSAAGADGAPSARALRMLAVACADAIGEARGALGSAAHAEAAVRRLAAALPELVPSRGADADGVSSQLAALAAELGGAEADGAHGADVLVGASGAAARARQADPLCVRGQACVRALGASLPASGHPRMSNVVSLFDGQRIRVRRSRCAQTWWRLTCGTLRPRCAHCCVLVLHCAHPLRPPPCARRANM